MKIRHDKLGDCIPWQKKYAWFPTVVLNTKEDRYYTIWLEYYQERATYCEGFRGLCRWYYDRITIDSDVNSVKDKQ